MDILKKIYYLFSVNERPKVLLVFLTMLGSAGLETLGIGLILPFLGIVSDPTLMHRNRVLAWLFEASHADSQQRFIVYCGVGLAVVFVIKNVLVGLVTAFQTRFVFDKQASLGRLLLSSYLGRPYLFHVQRNSAELINNAQFTCGMINTVFVPLLTVMAEALVLALTTTVLVVVAPIPALASFAMLGGVSGLYYRAIKKEIKKRGAIQHEQQRLQLKWLSQGLGGVKEVNLLGRSGFFVEKYAGHVEQAGHAGAYVTLAGQMSRLFIETIAFSGMVLIVSVLVWQGKATAAILPTLGLFGLAIIRMAPSLNRIMSNVAVIRAYKHYVDIAHHDLREAYGGSSVPDLGQTLVSKGNGHAESAVTFERGIEVRDLSFRYPNAADEALRGISLKIAKGQSVAFIGPSGAGKTTLVDSILGLLEPVSGGVFVDGRDIRENLRGWQGRIGYVAQTIYLSDDSVRANVAFGVDESEIDDARVWKALEAAQLDGFVRKLPEGLKTFVGERGVRLSGGQRQRIGIARALYHTPEVLVLDEATSALDQETELEVSRSIDALAGKITLIVIAHRLVTAQRCGRIFKISDGRLAAEGTFQEVCGVQAAVASVLSPVRE